MHKITFLLYDQMKFLNSFVKTRKTYTNFIPRRTHFPMEKKIPSIPQKSANTSNDTYTSSSSSEMFKPPLSPLSSPSPSSSSSPSPLSASPQLPISLSPPTSSSSPSTLASTSLLQSSSLLLPSNNEMHVSSMKPRMKVMSKSKKEDKHKKNMTEESDEIEKSILNISSIISQNLENQKNQEKQKMDEDDFFSHNIAYELRKINEPKKTELKRKIMKILYEL